MQRTSPLKVIGKVGNNAYKLELPENLKIHPVVSVAQLEPLPQGADPFGRVWEARQGPVESAQDKYPLYEIERLLARRVNKRTGLRQYLVKCKEWGSVHNQWYDETDLTGAKELVKEYNDAHPDTLEELEAKNSHRKRPNPAANTLTRRSTRLQLTSAPLADPTVPLSVNQDELTGTPPAPNDEKLAQPELRNHSSTQLRRR
jgi:hypothetical protein